MVMESNAAVKARQCTQREAAEKWRVDRSTVTTICRTAKQGALEALSARPGRPGKSAEQVELEEARAEVERLRATVTEQAVALHLHQGYVGDVCQPAWLSRSVRSRSKSC